MLYEKLLRGKPRRLGQNAPLSRLMKIRLKFARFLPAKTKITFPYNRLSGARHWLEDIINPQEAVCTLQLSRYNLYFARQTVGSHPEMGRFWITEDLQCNDKFSAYVDAQEFVRELLAIFDGIGEEV